MFCTDILQPVLYIFSPSTPQLLYYSHLPAALIALILGGYIFIKNKQSLVSTLLLFISVLFLVWSVFDLFLWTNIDSSQMSFVWSVINLVELLISASTLYFAYLFLEKKDAAFKYKLIVSISLLVFIVIIPTGLNLSSFNISNCESNQGLMINYYHFLEVLFLAWAIIYLINKIFLVKEKRDKRLAILFAVGVLCFMASFSGANLLASITEKWEILEYGLFGMPVFMGFLVYLIVKYKAFNIKLFAAQALVVALIVLIASEFAFVRNPTNIVLTAVTLALVTIFGWWLARVVKKVDEQKEQLEIANAELQKLDQAKNEFINIASHQLRTPVMVIKGVISMLRDGSIDSFDAATKKQFYDGAWAKSQKLEDIINDILNATSLVNRKDSAMDKKIEAIDLKEFFGTMIAGFEPEIKEREISLVLNPIPENVPVLYGQKQYLEEVFSNLITNAIKYTPSPKKTADIRDTRAGAATISINVAKSGENVIVTVRDNGIGIPEAALPKLFQKFSRADNAVDMYTDGTGLGLFIVKEIVEGHGGKVWVDSVENKGSTFFVQLPIRPQAKVDVKAYITQQAAS